MRKILAITIFIICLSFSTPVQAEENVSNQLEQILVQLENLDSVLQFFVDNEPTLQFLVDGNFWYEIQQPILDDLVAINNYFSILLSSDIVPDLDSIQADVALLTSNVALYVSQIVASINGVSAEVEDLHQWLISIDFGRIQHLLTQPQLDESLRNFLSQLNDNSSLLGQILSSIQSLDNTEGIQDSLDSIARALTQFGNVTIYLDLVEELENMDINLNLDLGAALSGLESDLSSVLDSIEHISYLLQNFIYMFADYKNDQELTNEKLRDFANWYQGTFFLGLQEWATSHREWLFRQKDREDAEKEYRDDLEQFLTYDAEMPTDSQVPYVAQLEQAGLEEPEMPDDKIYDASDNVEAQLEEVENELTEGMDLVDTQFKGFLQNLNFRWGKFNPVLSFSFKPPLDRNNYTMQFTYDFSTSRLLPPCKAASTGIWAIVLFVSSFLAITETFDELVEN